MGQVNRLWELWHYFNAKYFGGKLVPPMSIRITRGKTTDGYLYFPGNDRDTHFHLAHKNKICISTHQDTKHKSATLLHEMLHQYQIQVMRIEPVHDAWFNSYCRWIERHTKFGLRTGQRWK